MNELNMAIREAIAEASDDATPQRIAAGLAEQMTENEARTHLVMLMTDVVRALIRERRNTALAKAMSELRGDKANQSPKLAARREWWQEMLESRVHVGANDWKRLGDCTAGDLEFCIAEREIQINRTHQQIDNYRHLIKLMDEHHAETVDQLPREALAA
ncbi:Uncharacterised protein [Mycobacteroides abscessus subsp. abscessus]|uniref:hypothetical protein n=1 Tax=Mycobacteroides abscessus TaxID=36809 RepID=UPI00092B8A8F|nr:hypothetical protein [Mycobacteroides abscessus]SHR61620.1 Uncharacterised protein [Mycobacteroides abscessus subsp. abscessus]DAZ89914.1 TPA_asm: hypothetical protein PROPHIFSAT01-1_25 [Mycobacterium phage prophiFSAT01-1]